MGNQLVNNKNLCSKTSRQWFWMFSLWVLNLSTMNIFIQESHANGLGNFGYHIGTI
jgi:hypothetical protein